MFKKTKVIYIVSSIDKSFSFEWVASGMNRELLSLSFILLNPGPSKLESFLRSGNIPVTRLEFRGKISYPLTLIRLWWMLFRARPDIIHCHLFHATVLGLLAGRMAGIRRRIFTRHHGTIHHQHFPSGVRWDRMCNRLATDIVAVSDNVREILLQWENADASKIRRIPHGFDSGYFMNRRPEDVEKLRLRYRIPSGCPVIGVISRYTEWKGIQFIIPAFRQLLKTVPDAFLVLANARGDFGPEIKRLLGDVPKNSFAEIAFEDDLSSLYGLFDIFVHVPVDPYAEAFGQTYVESLLAGIPSVFTLSGVAREFIRHRVNALVVTYKDGESIFEALRLLISDNLLAEQIRHNGRLDALTFSKEAMSENLERLYLSKM